MTFTDRKYEINDKKSKVHKRTEKNLFTKSVKVLSDIIINKYENSICCLAHQYK